AQLRLVPPARRGAQSHAARARHAGPRLPPGQRQHRRRLRARRLRVAAELRGGRPARPRRHDAPPALLRRAPARARRAPLPRRTPPRDPRGRRRAPGLTRPARTEPAMTTAPYDAILFASFGGPEGQDDVIPFLRNVTAGRGVPDERLEEVAGHYRALGGRSPINAQNRELIGALEAEL